MKLNTQTLLLLVGGFIAWQMFKARQDAAKMQVEAQKVSNQAMKMAQDAISQISF